MIKFWWCSGFSSGSMNFQDCTEMRSNSKYDQRIWETDVWSSKDQDRPSYSFSISRCIGFIQQQYMDKCAFHVLLLWCVHPSSQICTMIIPIRCFTCGKIVGNKWEAYLRLLQSEYTEGDALDALGLKRYCCRRMLLSHVDLIEKLLNYAPLEKWLWLLQKTFTMDRLKLLQYIELWRPFKLFLCGQNYWQMFFPK